MGAPKDDKPTGSPTVVELETVVMSSITCAISYLILHLDNFTMRDIRAPIGAVKHHGLSCAELIVSSHGATASPVMATNPSSEGGGQAGSDRLGRWERHPLARRLHLPRKRRPSWSR